MKIDEQMKRLRAFACEEKSRSISAVVIKDGTAYVTDGRFCMKEKLDGDFDDVVTREDGKEIPIDAMMKFASLPDTAEKWYDLVDFKEVERSFAEQYKAERDLEMKMYRDRYKLSVCPSCGEEVWWDTWNDKIVDDTEPCEEVRIQSVSKAVRIRFGTGMNELFAVNFAYIFLVMKLYGDVELSFGYSEEYHCNHLYFRTKDRKMSAVLMPLRSLGEDECVTLDTKEIANADD